ncbi:MAG: hypothetical protein IJW72_05590 [Alphaproteobacteria bacterium]|nr:hypothetical protein [Alphaproteobacteria bacterium]
MSELGTLSSYALAIQQTQISLIKNSDEMQQKLVEMVFEDNRNVPISSHVGQHVDTSI